jgi:hypothetical protein
MARAGDCRTDTSSRPTQGSFDRAATAEALGCVPVHVCRQSSGPRGSGHVRVRFAPDGTVESTVVDQPPFAGTETGECVGAQFQRVRIPPFRGDAVSVGKSFVIE